MVNKARDKNGWNGNAIGRSDNEVHIDMDEKLQGIERGGELHIH